MINAALDCSRQRQMMEILKERGPAICQVCSKLAFNNSSQCVSAAV